MHSGPVLYIHVMTQLIGFYFFERFNLILAN